MTRMPRSWASGDQAGEIVGSPSRGSTASGPGCHSRGCAGEHGPELQPRGPRSAARSTQGSSRGSRCTSPGSAAGPLPDRRADCAERVDVPPEVLHRGPLLDESDSSTLLSLTHLSRRCNRCRRLGPRRADVGGRGEDGSMSTGEQEYRAVPGSGRTHDQARAASGPPTCGPSSRSSSCSAGTDRDPLPPCRAPRPPACSARTRRTSRPVREFADRHGLARRPRRRRRPGRSR